MPKPINREPWDASGSGRSVRRVVVSLRAAVWLALLGVSGVCGASTVSVSTFSVSTLSIAPDCLGVSVGDAGESPADAGSPSPARLPAVSSPADRMRRALLLRLSADRLLAHIQYLGSDSLAGRATGSAGERRAAAYIRGVLDASGLRPAGTDGEWLQEFPVHGALPLPQTRLRILPPGGPASIPLHGTDYVLHTTGASTAIVRPVPAVFAGYGIAAPEHDYNDYRSVDPAGSVVVYLSGEPPSEDPAWFDGPRLTLHANPEVKRRQAHARGAVGTIEIPSSRSGYRWDDRVRDFAFEQVTLPYGVSQNLSLALRPEAAGPLFEGSEAGLVQIVEWDSTSAMRSFPLVSEVEFEGRFRERDFTAANVAALLPGSDPLLRERYVIVAAHYDHLGMGPDASGEPAGRPGGEGVGGERTGSVRTDGTLTGRSRADGDRADSDRIYNGVIDNASGTAAVLEIARAFASLPRAPRRSLLFLLLSGEEAGLLGSRYYADHPLVPLHQTIAAVNVDGLAFLDTFDEVVGVGSEHSSLGLLLEEAAGRIGLATAEVPPTFADRDEFGQSDQYAFAQAGIPSILVTEGTAYRHLGREEGLRRLIEWGREIYHTPKDDLSQPIAAAAMLQHTQAVAALILDIAEGAIEPQWNPGSPFAAARLQSIAEGR